MSDRSPLLARKPLRIVFGSTGFPFISSSQACQRVLPGEYVVTLRAANQLGKAKREFKIVCGETLALTPHMGCFEIAAQALAQRYVARHGPLTVLYRPARKAWLARLIGAALRFYMRLRDVLPIPREWL